MARMPCPAVFFCFYEAIRTTMAARAAEKELAGRASTKAAAAKGKAKRHLASIGAAACLSISLLGDSEAQDF